MASKKSSSNDMSMKAVVIVALIVSFVGGYLVARAKYKPQIQELTKMVSSKDMTMEKMKANANKIVMKDGKMWVIEDGMVKAMENDIMMPNGTKVMTDGKVVNADGDEMQMKNDDAMDMNGKMMPQGGEDVETSAPSF